MSKKWWKSGLLTSGCALCMHAFAGNSFSIYVSNASDQNYVVTGIGGGGNSCWSSRDLNAVNRIAPRTTIKITTESEDSFVCHFKDKYQNFLVRSEDHSVSVAYNAVALDISNNAVRRDQDGQEVRDRTASILINPDHTQTLWGPLLVGYVPVNSDTAIPENLHDVGWASDARTLAFGNLATGSATLGKGFAGLQNGAVEMLDLTSRNWRELHDPGWKSAATQIHLAGNGNLYVGLENGAIELCNAACINSANPQNSWIELARPGNFPVIAMTSDEQGNLIVSAGAFPGHVRMYNLRTADWSDLQIPISTKVVGELAFINGALYAFTGSTAADTANSQNGLASILKYDPRESGTSAWTPILQLGGSSTAMLYTINHLTLVRNAERRVTKFVVASTLRATYTKHGQSGGVNIGDEYICDLTASREVCSPVHDAALNATVSSMHATPDNLYIGYSNGMVKRMDLATLAVTVLRTPDLKKPVAQLGYLNNTLYALLGDTASGDLLACRASCSGPNTVWENVDQTSGATAVMIADPQFGLLIGNKSMPMPEFVDSSGFL